jgi:hypothetical protein
MVFGLWIFLVDVEDRYTQAAKFFYKIHLIVFGFLFFLAVFADAKPCTGRPPVTTKTGISISLLRLCSLRGLVARVLEVGFLFCFFAF